MIIREGLRRMITEQEDVFYYLTLMNENYQHPAMPDGAEEGILRGLYLLVPAAEGEAQVQLLGSRHDPARGAGGADAAGRRLRRRGGRVERPELHRAARARAWRSSAGTRSTRARRPRRSWVETSARGGTTGPVVAATDYMRAFADQIRPWVDAALPRARHGRLRPQRLPQDAALVLRGGSPPRRAGGADRAGQGGRRSTPARRRRRSSPTASTPSGPRRGRSDDVAGTEQVLVPDIGDFDDVPVIEVLVAVGDEVAAEDPLVVLESDKATMEVPSPSAGKVAAIDDRRRRPASRKARRSCSSR